MTAGKDSQLAWTPVPVKEKGHECENRGIGWCVLEFGFYFVSYEKLSELSDIFRAVFQEYQICTIWIEGREN